MQGRLRSEVASVLEDGDDCETRDWRQTSVGDVWRKFLQKPRAVGWSRPWSLYVLARWCEINGVALR